MISRLQKIFGKNDIARGYALLAIDVQDDFVSKLSPERQKAFPKSINALAQTMRGFGVPVIWAGFHAMTDMVLDHETPKDVRNKAVREANLSALDIHKKDTILLKTRQNAFLYANFRSYALQQDIHTFILAGMSTPYCIASTAKGAVDNKFGCVVAYDHLASHMGIENATLNEPLPQTHLDSLTAALGSDSTRIVKMTAGDIIQELKTKTTNSRRPAWARTQELGTCNII